MDPTPQDRPCGRGGGHSYLRVGDALAAAPSGVGVVIHTGVCRKPSLVVERPRLVAMLLKPVGLAWVLLLMRPNVAALMGCTGATLEAFLRTALGTALAAGALALWVVAPLLVRLRLFGGKGF